MEIIKQKISSMTKQNIPEKEKGYNDVTDETDIIVRSDISLGLGIVLWEDML